MMQAAFVTGVAGVTWVEQIGRSLREGFFMFWETLWPLVLGFGLSGAVQAFVSRETMRNKLGNHSPRAIARASLYGMVSSSCSYAASAMSKSLFAKGADFIAANVFMFASTNLVVELGIVLVVLMGWQFAASEFIGGAIMIVLLACGGGLWLRGQAINDARNRLTGDTPTTSRDDHDQDHGHDGPHHVNVSAASERWQAKVRTKAGWADAATYTMADLSMLRRELLIGYVAAGFLTVLVPVSVWNVVFIPGHGFWTSLENAVVGPVIAIVSFVCSIGNVPLAAALWKGGISFGGVVAFLFADLITFPLLLIYRRYYGTRTMLRMLALFWAVMSIAGLATEGIFRAGGLVPSRHRAEIAPDHFSWNYTTFLNIIFLVVFAALFWAYRNRDRLGGGRGTTLDPVCGMQVEKETAPASVVPVGGGEDARVYFCSDRCRERFDRDAAHFV